MVLAMHTSTYTCTLFFLQMLTMLDLQQLAG